MQEASDRFLGVGIYPVPQVTRLTGIPSARIRRWIKGYDFRTGQERHRSQPVWKTQLPVVEKKAALSFLDLLELRFIDAFLTAGVSLSKIRKAAEMAADLVGHDHPFSTNTFRTDGKRIFGELTHQKTGKKAMIDLHDAQLGVAEFIIPSLTASIVFDEGTGRASKWRPAPEAPAVVLDPAREFGQPIIDDVGIQTATLVDAWKAEGSIDRVAKNFDLRADQVEQAIRFELRPAA
jgi:uncharacterized protein (DUF433 family)/DNA-binding transcriptional MerR regulator